MKSTSPLAILAVVLAGVGLLQCLLLLLTMPTVESSEASAHWLLITGVSLLVLTQVRDV